MNGRRGFELREEKATEGLKRETILMEGRSIKMRVGKIIMKEWGRF